MKTSVAGASKAQTIGPPRQKWAWGQGRPRPRTWGRQGVPQWRARGDGRWNGRGGANPHLSASRPMEGKEVSDLLNFMIERCATLTLVRNEFKNTHPGPVRGSPWPRQGQTWFSAGFKIGSDDPKFIILSILSMKVTGIYAIVRKRLNFLNFLKFLKLSS